MTTLTSLALTPSTSIATHSNFVGTDAYSINDPVVQLQIVAASCLFGEPSYYVSAKDTSAGRGVNRSRSSVSDHLMRILGGTVVPEMNDNNTTSHMESVIDAALAHDPERTLQLAASLRNDDNLRTTPQIILVRAANTKAVKGTGLVRKYAPTIIKRADEPAVQMAYQLRAFGRKIPNSLRRAWKDYLSGVSEYSLAKYQLKNREVKTIDVVRMARPKSDAITKLVHDELKTTGSTWESIMSAGGKWEDAIEIMGHMALLRNLRNFEQNEVDYNLYAQKLLDGVENGKQLPFRYFSAYSNVSTPQVLNLVNRCLEKSMCNLPTFDGNVAVLCDNSGSAHGTFSSSFGTVRVSDIANLTAVMTARQATGTGVVYPFGDTLESYTVDKHKDVLKQHRKVNRIGQTVGASTEAGIWHFWNNVIRNKEHVDHVFVYSDMQAGHCDLYARGSDNVDSDYVYNSGSAYSHKYIDVPSLINTYRKEVNPDVHVYLVQVAGYGDTIVPGVYDKTYIFGGWSGNLLHYADKLSKLGL